MDTILYYICVPLGYLMKWCWQLVSNYGVAIILFTLLTKIVLLPVSIWIQKNSILMVKIQPEVNFIKANYHGNFDAIADEQAKLFKKHKYRPMASIVPLILQIVLLLGVVYIINKPMNYLFGISDSVINSLANFINITTEDSSFQLSIIEAIKNGTITTSSVIEGVSAEVLADIIPTIKSFNLSFCGINLTTIPSVVFGWYLLVPVVAGASSWIMCHTQNLANVVQHEQGNASKYGIMIASVLLSLYLGLFVPAGTALYWIASNLMSIALMYILNAAINPKKYVDYEALEQSRKALEKAKEFGSLDKKSPFYKQMKKKEKEDYKKFKKIVNKHIVIYSEKSGFYKYYKDLINELLAKSNLTIHYITNDYNDNIFEVAKTNPKIKPYYISLKKTAILMMLVETDIFIMTTPDLNKYYLKRSFIKKDIEYIYVPHDAMSVHMGFNEGALDHYDTIFCSGKHVKAEVAKTEEVYNLPKKNLVEFGFPLLDELVKSAEKEVKENKKDKDAIKEILIAPSWQEDNLLDSCIDEIIESLYKNKNYHLTVRPHPEYMKRFGFKMDKLVEKYKDYKSDRLKFELDFSSNKSIYTSDMLITDWSGIAAEFAFGTKRPCIFVNTKMKVCNTNWENIGIVPTEILIRDKVGVSVNKEDVNTIDTVVEKLFKDHKKYKEDISNYFETYTYNHGTAAAEGAKYILGSLLEKQKQKKEGGN
ncbi:MAG: membrane protein insertase YidC [Clostridia bacterium]|nr:membrane protein insertase YidC [Clostridia bacterium]